MESDHPMNPLTVCHDCDALYRIPELPASGGVVHCIRCGAELYRQYGHSLDNSLAFTLAGCILFLIANLNPLLILKFGGRMQGNTLMAGVEAMWHEGMWDLAILVFGTSLFFPFFTLFGMLYILLPLKFGWRPWKLAMMFRLINAITPWAMIGVYMLGIFVAFVKLMSMATVVPGIALYAFLGILLITSAAKASLNPQLIWNQVPVSS